MKDGNMHGKYNKPTKTKVPSFTVCYFVKYLVNLRSDNQKSIMIRKNVKKSYNTYSFIKQIKVHNSTFMFSFSTKT